MVTFIKKSGFFRMIRQGTAGALMLCAALSAQAIAQTRDPGVYYTLSGDPTDPTYQVALQQMQSMYKKDPWLWNGSNWILYPAIGLGETYLNADDFPEIIAYPTEDKEEGKKFCIEHLKCPHLVLEVRDTGVRKLLQINAYTITRDDKISNGYWNLRVHTKSPDVDAFYYELYRYEPKVDGYVPVSR